MRRALMEHILPLPSHSRRHAHSRSPRAAKRTTTTTTSADAHFVYAPNRYMDVHKLLAARSQRVVNVHIGSEHLTRANGALRKRFVWGTDAYTDDSDLVCVLVHSGFVHLHTKPHYQFLSLKLMLQPHVSRVSPPFRSCERFGLCSRAWGSHYDGARMSVLSVHAVDAQRRCVRVARAPLLPSAPSQLCAWRLRRIVSRAHAAGVVKRVNAGGARSLSSWLCFDRLNAPCHTYHISHVAWLRDGNVVADARARLQREAMYMENELHRYEICAVPHAAGAHMVRFARVKRSALARQLLLEATPERASPCPMRDADLTHVQQLPWTALQWGVAGVRVNGVQYAISKLSFRALRAA